MTFLSAPSEGWTLSSIPAAKEHHDQPTQIIRLDLVESKTKTLLDALRSRKKATLHTGKQITIDYGEHKLVLQNAQATHPSDFFHISQKQDKKLYFSGKLSHTLETRQARDATEKADTALANLENTLKSMKEERAQNEVNVLSSKDDMKLLNRKDHKPSPLLSSGIRRDQIFGATARSTPSSPHRGALRSPNLAPTSAPLSALGGGASEDKLRLEAIKIPLIHLVASQSLSSKSIVDKLRAPKGDCERLIDRYAKDSQSDVGKKELKERTYKDLDVWKFPYQSEADRKSAIDRAIHAFDRMRLDKADPIWQMLLQPSERGRGKNLSRLNLNKPAPAPSLLKPDHEDGKGYASDREGSKSPNHKADKVSEKKGREETTTTKAKGRPVSPAPPKRREPSQARAQPAGTKFKSAERIEDSDEEAEGTEVVKVKSTKNQSSPSRSHTRNLSPKKQIHKSTLSNSSSGSDSSDNQTTNKSLKPPSRDQANKNTRPRHDSSPQKPSPLGSSPPANSTDFDSSSSSKQSQSSAPSSPPSSTDMPIAKQKQKYSPIISERTREISRGRPPVKRRSDDHENLPPPKRHQVNGGPIDTRNTQETKSTTERPAVARRTTDSDQSSTSEKGPPAREEVMDEAKRFHVYYKKYKDLHEKLETKPEEERDEKDMDNLLNMHKRLTEMKAEIWDNWGRVEKVTVA